MLPFFSRITLIVLVALTAPMLLWSQNFPVKFLDINQGLSNNSVMNMYQDRDGYMWFGTYDGLNRYDGYEFKIFRNTIGDSNSLVTNTVYTIEGDSARNLWVGGQNGACVYHPVSASFSQLYYYTINGQVNKLSDIVHVVRTIDQDMVLACTQNLGLLMYTSGNRIGKQVPLQLDGKTTTGYDVTAIETVTGADYCWVFIRQSGLYRFHFKSGQLELVNVPIRQVNYIKRNAADNIMWLVSDNGLYQLNEKTMSLSGNLMPEAVKLTNVLPDKTGGLWIATDGAGIYKMEKGSPAPVSFRSAGSSPLVKSNSVWVIYEDGVGRMWFGTLRAGISMMDSQPQFFTHVMYTGDSKNYADNFILSFCEDENKNVLIGTDGAGLHYWNRSTNTLSQLAKRQPGGLSSNFITSIIRDEKKDTWISTWFGGINRIRGNNIKHYECVNPTTSLVEPNTWLVFEDRNKTIWASTTNNGCLYRLNRELDKFELFDAAVRDVQSLAQTSDGKIWAGNYSSLIQLEIPGKQHKVYPLGVPVRSILEDHHGQLWVGTQDGGLLLFNRPDGSYRRFSTKDGLPGNTLLRILEDNTGFLWMSTYNGLTRFDPVKKEFQNFSVSDGLQSNQFSFNAGLALSNGEFLFGGINGFNIFRPADVTSLTKPSRVLLSSLLVNNVPIEKDSSLVTRRSFGNVQELRLPYDQTNLSIDFVALNYSNADKINYAYYLEGWDKDWNYTGKGRKANYSRLHEGTYQFKLKVSDSYGNWNSGETLLTIIVLPPWYRTWAAYLLYTLVITGLLYIYVTYTRRQERLKYEVRLAHLEGEKEKELAERQLSVFTNISHEFRSPISLIINPLKRAIGGKSEDPEDLVVAHRNARRLLRLVDQLLLFRKADSGADDLQLSSLELTSMCREVYQCFTSQAREKNINYRFDHPSGEITIYGDFEKLEIALFNLISNAFKFTPDDGNITLAIREGSDDVAISISDSGPGISRDDADRIFEKFGQGRSQSSKKAGFGIGLFLVKRFVEQHRGSVSCKSEIGKGSSFTIMLKKGSAHFTGTSISDQPVQKSELLKEMLEEDVKTVTPVTAPKSRGLSVDEVVTGKKSVLVVDDNEEIRNYLQKLFSPLYLVKTASDGEEGLAQARSIIPDLVVSDISMSGLNGLELCRKIKQSESLGHIPVILLTASSNPETKLQGISGGADDYITKPFDSDMLLARVDALMKSRNQLRRYFLDSITLKENSHKVPAEYQEFLKKCIEVIEANIGKEEFNIKTFSKAMGMSHSGLYTRIKTISGQTLNAFIRSIRLRRAAVLMLTENTNVTEAGFQVGFEDARYFREQFTKLFGITPSEYIKKYRHSFNRDLNTIKKSEA